MIDKIIHIVLLIFLPPLLPGIINKTKAAFGGRVGPPPLQTYYDIIKLMRKELVISETTTWIFIAGPVVTLATLLLAGLLVPFGYADAPVSFTGDLIFFAYLLGLSRFFTTAAALDTGSSFEGMGSAREVAFACLAEPSLFMALLVLAKVSGSLNLAAMLSGPVGGFTLAVAAPLMLVAIGLFVVLLAENSRIPVDDPNTHLELTMIHEAMVLDHGGPLMGMIQYASAVKLFIISAVLLHVMLPFGAVGEWRDWGMFVVSMVGLSVVVGIVESIMARLQMRHVPSLLVAAMLFCFFGFILLVR